MSARELSVDLDAWNRTERPYPHRCLHELFWEQAARTPDNIAVEGDDRLLTYRESTTGRAGSPPISRSSASPMRCVSDSRRSEERR